MEKWARGTLPLRKEGKWKLLPSFLFLSSFLSTSSLISFFQLFNSNFLSSTPSRDRLSIYLGPQQLFCFRPTSLSSNRNLLLLYFFFNHLQWDSILNPFFQLESMQPTVSQIPFATLLAGSDSVSPYAAPSA